MLFLLRYLAHGNEPKPSRRKIERDLLEQLHTCVPDARVVNTSVGRILVEADEARARPALASLHGLTSFSPVRLVAAAALEQHAVDEARARFAADPALHRFAVRVRRVADVPPASGTAPSPAIAARLGALIGEALGDRGAVVDLDRPEYLLRVEIHGDEAFLFDEVIAGVDADRDRADDPARDRPGDPARDRGDDPPAEPRFLVDQMLGRLVTRLRLLGWDAAYVPDVADSFLVRKALAEERVLLTRDRPLADSQAARIVFVASLDPEAQLREVIAVLGLRPRAALVFTRCTVCNEPVEPVPASARPSLADRVPAHVLESYDDFTTCPRCHRVYWKGAQYHRLLATLDDLI